MAGNPKFFLSGEDSEDPDKVREFANEILARTQQRTEGLKLLKPYEPTGWADELLTPESRERRAKRAAAPPLTEEERAAAKERGRNKARGRMIFSQIKEEAQRQQRKA